MKKIRLSIIALALTALTSTQLSADSGRSLGQIYRECGIGAMLFSDDETLAVISNIIWDLGTTATSSNISSDGTCKGHSAKVAMFIGGSYDKLENEIAVGRGKYIETLSKITGKDIQTIRTSFAKIVADKKFSSMQKEEKAEKLFKIVSI